MDDNRLAPLPTTSEQRELSTEELQDGSYDIHYKPARRRGGGRPVKHYKVTDMGKVKQPRRDELAIYVNGVPWYTRAQMIDKFNISTSTFYYRVQTEQIEKITIDGLSLYR